MRRTGTIIAIVVVGLLLIQGYRTSRISPKPTGEDDAQTTAAQADMPTSDLLPAGAAAPIPAAEDLGITSWLDEFNQSREAQATTNELTAEEKQQLIDYLIASSNIPFPQDPVFLREAFLENKDGKPEKLDQVIKGFEDGLAALKHLTPPDRLTATHEASASQIADLLGVYKELRGQTGRSITEVWQEPTMAGLRERSSRTVAELRDLVTRFELELPPDILPEYTL